MIQEHCDRVTFWWTNSSVVDLNGLEGKIHGFTY